MNFLNDLNEIQRRAVENVDGASLIIAGAGSGKTRVLTYRIAHLLQLGKSPYGIMALTFTNKAAKEMKERIGALVGTELASKLWMGTFHSIFARILRHEAQHIGYKREFTIYDTVDSKNLLKTIVKDLHLDPQVYKVRDLLGRISAAKNNLVTVRQYLNDPKAQQVDATMNRPETGRIYQIYTERCKRADAMDFDDLLFNTNVLFRDFPEVKARYQERFKYLLVDEYQDTNRSQYLIVKQLTAKHQNICVVGDDAQSIYAFRGAKIENIFNFKNDYPEHQLFKLEQNYRSTQTIVEAANSVIKHNKRQIAKKVFSENDKGAKIKITATFTEAEEGHTVASTIFDRHYNEHFDFNEFAILYRTNAQSRVFEETLRKNNIPYKIYGGMSFYQRKEIKDLLAYCRLTINPADDEAIKRVINYPKRGIGATSLQRIEALATETNQPIWNVLQNIRESSLKISSRVVNQLDLFTELIQSFSASLHTLDAYDLARNIASKSGLLKDLYSDKSPEGVSRHENVQELLNGIRDFIEKQGNNDNTITLEEYLQEVALMVNEDNEKEEDHKRVALMTIHAAKGLEFANVFVVGLEEGLFPSNFTVSSQSDLEEERRLFYVAITRAKQYLDISYSKSRYRWGELQNCTASRFISEIDERFVDLPGENYDDTLNELSETLIQEHKSTFRKPKQPAFSRKHNFAKTTKKQQVTPPSQRPERKLKPLSKTQQPTTQNSTSKSGTPASISTGMIVEHQRFGKGKVIGIEGETPNTKAVIDFQKVGQKKLLLKFARLAVLSNE